VSLAGTDLPVCAPALPRQLTPAVLRGRLRRDLLQVDIRVRAVGTEREVFEKTPFIVSYRYRCASRACRGHEQSIVDWESGQLARRNLQTHTPDEAKALHRARFLDEMCSSRRDTYFFVGNQHQHPQSFLVLGVFWPPVGSRPAPTLGF